MGPNCGTIHVTYVLNDSYREVLKLFILTRKLGARMKFSEVINDFAEYMTRLEQEIM